MPDSYMGKYAYIRMYLCERVCVSMYTLIYLRRDHEFFNLFLLEDIGERGWADK